MIEFLSNIWGNTPVSCSNGWIGKIPAIRASVWALLVFWNIWEIFVIVVNSPCSVVSGNLWFMASCSNSTVNSIQQWWFAIIAIRFPNNNVSNFVIDSPLSFSNKGFWVIVRHEIGCWSTCWSNSVVTTISSTSIACVSPWRLLLIISTDDPIHVVHFVPFVKEFFFNSEIVDNPGYWRERITPRWIFKKTRLSCFKIGFSKDSSVESKTDGQFFWWDSKFKIFLGWGLETTCIVAGEILLKGLSCSVLTGDCCFVAGTISDS